MNLALALFAQIGGDAMIHNLLALIIFLACIGILWMICRAAGANADVLYWLKIAFLACCGILVINFLLTLIGHPFIRW
jgi:hypothetical protein